jgi:2'-5' RNA ligase
VPRLFVAVWPPADAVDRLRALRRPSVDGVRWTSEESWHVTLRFLGQADAGDAIAALATFDGHQCEVVMGPEPRRLFRGVLGVPVRGLDELAAAVVGATAHVGVPPEDRPFRGHITLARWRRGPPPRCPGRIEARWTVETVALVESHTSSHGARYETIALVPLRA